MAKKTDNAYESIATVTGSTIYSSNISIGCVYVLHMLNLILHYLYIRWAVLGICICLVYTIYILTISLKHRLHLVFIYTCYFIKDRLHYSVKLGCARYPYMLSIRNVYTPTTL